MASLNDFLAELKSIIETGFSVNGVNFLGSELDLVNFKAASSSFKVKTSKGALGEEFMGPVMVIHETDVDYFRLVGKRSLDYNFNLDFFFTDSAFSKTVNAAVLKGPELARHIGEHIALALDVSKSQFVTTSVQSLTALPVPSETGRIENTDICGGRVSFNVKFR